MHLAVGGQKTLTPVGGAECGVWGNLRERESEVG